MLDKRHQIFKHKHFVLAIDHYNPLAIVRSLGEEGLNPIVLLNGHKSSRIERSKYVKDIFYFDSFEAALDYLIQNYSNEEFKPFIYNGTDETTLLLDNNYEKLKDHFYFMNGGGRLSPFMEKYSQTITADKVGIQIPREELLKTGTLPTSLRYPVMTKATTSAKGGNWKANAFICENESELKQAYSQMSVDTILVQEYIRKKNELCIDGISINGGEKVFMPYGCNYFSMTKDSYGGYIYYTPFNDKDLVSKITSLLREFHYSGIFCIEFLEGEDGKYYFLEVNLRHSGWGYAYTYGGYNLPVRWAISTLENEISMHNFKLKKYFTAMSEWDDINTRFFNREISLFRWIKDFIKVDCTLYSNRKDNLFFYKNVLGMIVSAIKRR